MDYAFLSAERIYQNFQGLMGFLFGGIYTKDGGEEGLGQMNHQIIHPSPFALHLLWW
jgi:hypothetical protein